MPEKLIIANTVVLAGINPDGDVRPIANGPAVLAAGLDPDGLPHILAVDVDGNLNGGGSGGLYSALAIVEDQQTQNTLSGEFANGAWRTRILNTEVVDTGDHISVVNNQIICAIGTWHIYATAPAFGVGRHQLRIWNATDSTLLVTGICSYAAGTGGGHAILDGYFTIAAQKTIELQHRCELTVATRGLGAESNFGPEVFAHVRLEKLT